METLLAGALLGAGASVLSAYSPHNQYKHPLRQTLSLEDYRRQGMDPVTWVGSRLEANAPATELYSRCRLPQAGQSVISAHKAVERLRAVYLQTSQDGIGKSFQRFGKPLSMFPAYTHSGGPEHITVFKGSKLAKMFPKESSNSNPVMTYHMNEENGPNPRGAVVTEYVPFESERYRRWPVGRWRAREIGL